jgi:hypothetical protein
MWSPSWFQEHSVESWRGPHRSRHRSWNRRPWRSSPLGPDFCWGWMSCCPYEAKVIKNGLSSRGFSLTGKALTQLRPPAQPCPAAQPSQPSPATQPPTQPMNWLDRDGSCLQHSNKCTKQFSWSLSIYPLPSPPSGRLTYTPWFYPWESLPHGFIHGRDHTKSWKRYSGEKSTLKSIKSFRYSCLKLTFRWCISWFCMYLITLWRSESL